MKPMLKLFNFEKKDWKTNFFYYSKFIFVNICLILAFLFFILLIVFFGLYNNINSLNTYHDFKYRVLNIVFKVLTSLMFLLITNYFFIKHKHNLKLQHYFLLTFILFCFLADIVITLNFIAGAILFFVAHCFYFVYLYLTYKITVKKFWYFLIFLILVLIFINILFGFGVFEKNILFWVFANFYAVIFSICLVYTFLLLLYEHNTACLYLFVGYLLFYGSDLILMFNEFVNNLSFIVTCTLTFFNLLCYYIGMHIIAINTKNLIF